MLQQTSRGANDEVAGGHHLGLREVVRAPDDQAGREVVVLPHLLQRLERLLGELSGGADDQRAEPIVSGPLLAEEALQDGNKEGQGFPGSRLRGTENVFALEGEGQGLALYLRRIAEIAIF